MKTMFDTGTNKIILIVCHLIAATQAKEADYGGCDAPLGMESGHIRDEDLSASSTDNPTTGPQFGRLNNETASGAWCPTRSSTSNESEEWLQIVLDQIYKITAVATQGRYDHGKGAEFSRQISLKYYSPESRKWDLFVPRTGGSRLRSNNDTYTSVKTYLDRALYTSCIRVLPHGGDRTVCLRAELYGCLPEKEDSQKNSQVETAWYQNSTYWLIGGLVVVSCVACVTTISLLRTRRSRKNTTDNRVYIENITLCPKCLNNGNNNNGYNSTARRNQTQTNSEINLLTNERRRHNH